jgi:REP element-mobilizing transposase RayT
MARPLRLSFEGAVYHITARGNRREPIFHSDDDRADFIVKMKETFEKYSFTCYAYCLMDNHYHLFVKTSMANISDGMHYLNSSYSNGFKARNGIMGVVFQGRYKSMLVDEDSYALALSAYIHLNPHRAGVVDDLNKYRWSSFRAYAGRVRPEAWLDIDFILRQFDNDGAKARMKYRRFVRERLSMQDPVRESFGSIALGSEEFIDKITKRFRSFGRKREVPSSRSFGSRTPEEVLATIAAAFKVDIEEVLGRRRGNIYRQLAIYMVKRYTGLSLKEIGNVFGMDYAAVSQASRRFYEMSLEERKIMRLRKSAEKAIMHLA